MIFVVHVECSDGNYFDVDVDTGDTKPESLSVTAHTYRVEDFSGNGTRLYFVSAPPE